MISTDNYSRAYVIWNGYNAVLNNYQEYSLDDNHTVNLYFQSTSMHIFHAAGLKCIALKKSAWGLM